MLEAAALPSQGPSFMKENMQTRYKNEYTAVPVYIPVLVVQIV